MEDRTGLNFQPRESIIQIINIPRNQGLSVQTFVVKIFLQKLETSNDSISWFKFYGQLLG